jgi:hypothetical protein
MKNMVINNLIERRLHIALKADVFRLRYTLLFLIILLYLY